MADASFFNNINDLVIEDGSFNFNVQHGPVTNYRTATIYNNSNVQHTQGTIAFLVANIADHLLCIMCSCQKSRVRIFYWSKWLVACYFNYAVYIQSFLLDTIIPQGAGSQALYLLLKKAQQLIGVLPVAHFELARHCIGWGRPHTTTNELGNNIVSVGVPLFTSSLFSALPAAVQFMAFYILVAMVVLDILHPMRLERRIRPGVFVKVLDALGKYHDFPWAACENLTVRCELETSILLTISLDIPCRICQTLSKPARFLVH